MRRNREQDRRSTALAEEAGWTAVRKWECEVRDDPTGVATEILALRRPAR